MSWKNKTILFLAFVLIGVALIRYDLRDPDQPVLTLQKLDGETADSYAIDTHTERFNTNGQLASTMSAPRLDHFKSKGVSVIVSPKVNSVQANGQWFATSDTAQQFDNDDHIELEHNVNIRQSSEGQADITLETPWLYLDPHTERAHTDQEVVITRGTGKTTAVGMQADLQSKHVDLLSQVETLYEPAR
ncbi:LPS export ABC transporter periplasmic protein LptC [Pokkaliibacter sp. CJK22405]|uniref:LPS export ABC transporter periplasmic protein LptC n=1 Tax=Pokkaliibacter sp. CJK22405 TaxID=3384615 RepID=UPI003984AEB0